jgi:hypothetical protein
MSQTEDDMRIGYIILASCLGLLGPGLTYGDWLPEVNLTNETAFEKYTSNNNAWCVAPDTAGDVYVVWQDRREGSWRIYHSIREDSTWSPASRLVDDYYSTDPSIATDAFGCVHVVWRDARDGSYHIYYKEKTESSWSADTLITDSNSARYPSLDVDATGSVHVVWQEFIDGNWEIYYKMRDSLGSWQPDERLTIDASPSGMASVTADMSGDVHVAWTDSRDGNNEIYYKYGTGGVWSSDTALTADDDLISSYSSMVTDIDGEIHVVWHDQRSGFWEIYHKEKTGSGWTADASIVSIGNPGWPNITSDCLGNIHVVWLDSRDGYWRVYYKMRDTSGMWSADFPVSASSYPYQGVAGNPSVAADRYGNVHVVWHVDYWDSLDILDGGDIFYRTKEAPVGVEQWFGVGTSMPNPVELWQNRPNPFNQSTEIRFEVGQPAHVVLQIYDITGRLVRTLVRGRIDNNVRVVRWDGKDDCGREVGAGTFLCRLEVGSRIFSRKMILIE